MAVAESRSRSSSSMEDAEARLFVRLAWCCANQPVPGQHLAVARATRSLRSRASTRACEDACRDVR
eukprot:1158008-Pelagomonas_calceolata.AAC.14